MERLDTDIKENKLLMVPICLNVLIKHLPIRTYSYHGTDFFYKYGEREQFVSQFIKNIYNINQNIFFVGNKNSQIQVDTAEMKIYCMTYRGCFV